MLIPLNTFMVDKPEEGTDGRKSNTRDCEKKSEIEIDAAEYSGQQTQVEKSTNLVDISGLVQYIVGVLQQLLLHWDTQMSNYCTQSSFLWVSYGPHLLGRTMIGLCCLIPAFVTT